MCKWRHQVEYIFCKSNEFKRIVMRASKTDTNLGAITHLAATVIN